MSADAGLIAQLAAPGMAFADVADLGQTVPLPAGEAVHVVKAGEKRRRDFALGRYCAHRALERLGTPTALVAMGARGAPLWPSGIVGSITHTQCYAAAIVARAGAFSALGIDAEQIDDVTDRIAPRLFRREEREMLDGMAEAPRRRAAAILFSAKEAFYKACLGEDGALQFQTLLVELQPNGFTVRQPDSEGARQGHGRFVIDGKIVLTLVSLPG